MNRLSETDIQKLGTRVKKAVEDTHLHAQELEVTEVRKIQRNAYLANVCFVDEHMVQNLAVLLQDDTAYVYLPIKESLPEKQVTKEEIEDLAITVAREAQLQLEHVRVKKVIKPAVTTRLAEVRAVVDGSRNVDFLATHDGGDFRLHAGLESFVQASKRVPSVAQPEPDVRSWKQVAVRLVELLLDRLTTMNNIWRLLGFLSVVWVVVTVAMAMVGASDLILASLIGVLVILVLSTFGSYLFSTWLQLRFFELLRRESEDAWDLGQFAIYLGYLEKMTEKRILNWISQEERTRKEYEDKPKQLQEALLQLEKRFIDEVYDDFRIRERDLTGGFIARFCEKDAAEKQLERISRILFALAQDKLHADSGTAT